MSSATINASAVGYDVDAGASGAINAFTTTLPLDPRILLGAVGSLVSGVVTTPFEVAKVKQQNLTPLPNVCQASQPGVLSTIRRTIAKEGVRGAYAGLTPTVLMSVPNFVLFLISADEIVVYLRRRQQVSTSAQVPQLALSDNTIPFVGGAIARLIATTAVAPLEMLRTRAASLSSRSTLGNQPALIRVGNELGVILKKDGVGALYKGLVPSLWRDVPFAAIYMVCLERFREASRPLFNLSEHPTSKQRQAGFEFTNAALAGMVAASFTAPMDVVKTRLQSVPQQGQMKTPPQPVLEVLRSIVRKEGLAGLWRGNQARMMKVAPQYAIMISFYEVGKKILA